MITNEKNNLTKRIRSGILNRKCLLNLYDILILIAVEAVMLVALPSADFRPSWMSILLHIVIFTCCMFGFRHLLGVYRHILRYGGSSAYIRLIAADSLSGLVYYLLQAILPIGEIEFIRVLSIVSLNLLISLVIRLVYLFLYEYANRHPEQINHFWNFLGLLSGFAIPRPGGTGKNPVNPNKTNIAIVGAGYVGAMLAEELLQNPNGTYYPRCFIDIDQSKIGREITGVPVISDQQATVEKLAEYGVKEIVFALPKVLPERKKALYEQYQKTGLKLKVYDYPMMQSTKDDKRLMREIKIEELLFRQPIQLRNDITHAYYRDKTILITGGGGSIGSELCRQLARMSPRKLVILDVYENGAYDVQQELRLVFGTNIEIEIEILSVCDRKGLEKVFASHRPDVVIHAAAHKHVPLMEHNCCEAIKNNVFGTFNTVSLSLEYQVEKFVMISTDKAVNPTNVMGATKRMCELIVQGHSQLSSNTLFTIVRFGNVLGSAGSVIPLFKRQIEQGGPVTITDKRIIRYFMTIPEASQLVLEAGMMANSNELFVLDMGNPVRILDLAESLIRLSGLEPYRDIDIVETGLRPGEKLYEELLVQPEELEKTDNSLIFIEREAPISFADMQEKLDELTTALSAQNDAQARIALMNVIPTFHTSDEVNRSAVNAREMQLARSGNAAHPDNATLPV